MRRRIAVAAALLCAAAAVPHAVHSQASLVPDRGWAIRPSTPDAQAFTLPSEILGEQRRLFVSLPPSHALTDRQYPLFLVFDGESLLGPVVTAATALARAGHAPEAVIAAVENTDRLRDLSPPGIAVSGNDGSGRADLFVRFLAEELRPALAAHFRAGGPATLIGHSSGGLFVHYAAATRPDAFGWVLALDSPMHLGEGRATRPLVDLAASTNEALRLVSMETRFGWSNAEWSNLSRAAPRSWSLHRESVPDETHNSMVWPASYAGLKALFAHYSIVSMGDLTPPQRLAEFDGREGVDGLPPPRSLLRDVVEDRIGAVVVDEARSTLGRLSAAYGATPDVQALGDRIDAARPEDLEGPTLDVLLSTPVAPAEEARVLVGEWRGYTITEGATTRTELGLTVTIEDGVPVAAFTYPQGPGHDVEYFTVDGTTVHIGYMNRMNPHGMLLYEGTVQGDVFEGDFVLRGVVFEMPGGRELPRMRFRLERTGR